MTKPESKVACMRQIRNGLEVAGRRIEWDRRMGHRDHSWGNRDWGVPHHWKWFVAYTDSDCFADSHWLTHLVDQLERSDAVAVGGPNLTPEDGWLAGCVAASDAFSPCRDGLDVLAKAGITAVAQPGGSKKDDEISAAAEKLDKHRARR